MAYGPIWGGFHVYAYVLVKAEKDNREPNCVSWDVNKEIMPKYNESLVRAH